MRSGGQRERECVGVCAGAYACCVWGSMRSAKKSKVILFCGFVGQEAQQPCLPRFKFRPERTA